MMNNMADMFGKIQEMQTKMAEMKARLGELEVTADAGGGMVKVTANGNREVLSISIDPSLVTPDDVEMLEDLTVAAVNKALREAEKAGQQKMTELTAGMFPGGLPGLDPGKFGL
jgi:DNA-binding YbaB/EbfC family protein